MLFLLPLILVWSLDYATKSWALSLVKSFELGLVKFELVYNHGIILGWLSDVPLTIKKTVLTTFAALIVSAYVLILVIVPMKSKNLQVGLSILVGGILGNVTDRLFGFAVVDFFSFNFGSFQTPFYNVADLCQWIGYALIALGLYQDSQFYWPTKDYRNNYLVNPSFQARCGLLLGLLNLIVGSIFLVFGLTFFIEHSFRVHYLVCGALILLLVTIVGFVTGIILSHRIAGPIYALQKNINESLLGKKAPLKLRKNDELKELEEIHHKIYDRL